MPPISCNRLVGLSVLTFVVLVLIISTIHRGAIPIETIKDAAQSAASSAQNFCANDMPNFSKPSFQSSVSRLYDSIVHSPTEESYVDPFGTKFHVRQPIWTKPLGNEVVIVDMDTRAPDKQNEVFGSEKINWETMAGKEGGGMLSASFMNHFFYAQIHGYDYKYFRAQDMKDHHNTWIKPHVIDEFLHSYRFVVFIDADATIQHLEVPMEWLFNRWGVTMNTSIAMPIDTKQILSGDENEASYDSKGKLTLNTGFVVAQALPYTFEMMTAWKTCTKGKRYPDCGKWKKEWSHEQRAFSEYIRYDFNPDGNNIVEIPCDDAMGYPGLAANHPHIISDCKGQFVRHHTIDKDMTKADAGNAMVQSLSQILQKTLIKNKRSVWIEEGDNGFLKDFQEKKV